MARVTVEDCVEKIQNRFELVMMASQRAREIGSGAPLLVDRDHDKNTVVSLRELAEDKVQQETLKEDLIRSHQRIIEMEDDEDVIDLMDGEEGWDAIAAQSSAVDLSEFEGDDDDGIGLKSLAGNNVDDDDDF
ncbi:MAG: DNA-directed RNA polymerase subunit omega [Rhodospirillales bacterium]|nr:DNA-directed RNA polymerase subunit omega [Rhodospirillales bacterium]